MSKQFTETTGTIIEALHHKHGYYTITMRSLVSGDSTEIGRILEFRGVRAIQFGEPALVSALRPDTLRALADLAERIAP